jgi:hypothetical protein
MGVDKRWTGRNTLLHDGFLSMGWFTNVADRCDPVAPREPFAEWQQVVASPAAARYGVGQGVDCKPGEEADGNSV